MINQQDIRAIVSGSHADFLIYLTALVDPIVVGDKYPRARLLAAFTKWAKTRDFDTDDADVSKWREVCGNGLMKKVAK
jgi:hypothetical protein